MTIPEMPAGFMDGPAPGQEEPKAVAVVPVVAGIMAGPGETASTAVAAMAKAQVEARYLMALQRPRSMATVRVKLLEACKRHRFAESARYKKPIGGKQFLDGWSIRFAEEAARSLGNLLVEAAVTYDSAEVRVLRVMVTDLESNLSYPFDVSVTKTVERRSPDGKQVLGQRKNSQGQTTYIVAATDDDVLNKQNALVSKAMRTGILRVLPGDIAEEAMEVVRDTLLAEDRKDPGARAKRLADGFFSMGVMPEAVERLLGHPLAQCTPADVELLRTWGNALKEGEATWKEIVEVFAPERGTDDAAATASAKAAGVAALTERVAAAAARRKGGDAPKVEDAPSHPKPIVEGGK